MTGPIVAGWRRVELWLWARLFIFMIVLGIGTRRRRMSHNNGIAGRGRLRIVDRPEIPPTDFFEPGKAFACRLRHGTVGYMDDAISEVRSASLKFADTDFESPLDIQMNTGEHCFFWNARSFLDFAFSRHEKGGIEYLSYYSRHPEGRMSAASAFARAPAHYDGMYFHSHTPFAWNARDGKPRYARFRLIPGDRAPQDPPIDPAYVARMRDDPAQAAVLADQRTLPAETRNVNYLKEDWAGRVAAGGIRYVLQVQLHEVSAADPPEVRNALMPWDQATHPYHDLAEVEIDEVLPPAESDRMAFEITNMPPSMGILPAISMDDYNSLNYFRKHSIWAIRTRRAFLRMLGPNEIVPDNAPRNMRPSGM